MSWWNEFAGKYGIEQEKIERMASVNVAEGGRFPLPNIGEEALVYITRDPIEVVSETLRERGIDTAYFARCRKVTLKNGNYEVGNVEYDLPISKTMAMTAIASLRRAGITDNSLEGRVFLITARQWADAPEEYRRGRTAVKTYVMSFRKDITEKVGGKVEKESPEVVL